MPATALTSTPTLGQKNRILDPLISAKMNSHIGNTIIDFAKTLFGDQTVEDKLTEAKADVRAMDYKNGAGSDPEKYACRGLMRAHLTLKGMVGEDGNAAELRAICVNFYGEDTVKAQEEAIAAGY